VGIPLLVSGHAFRAMYSERLDKSEVLNREGRKEIAKDAKKK
jgi:hypothetical protein